MNHLFLKHLISFLFFQCRCLDLLFKGIRQSVLTRKTKTVLPLTDGHRTKEKTSFTSNLKWLSRDLLSPSSMYKMVEYPAHRCIRIA